MKNCLYICNGYEGIPGITFSWVLFLATRHEKDRLFYIFDYFVTALGNLFGGLFLGRGSGELVRP
jgi:hypothetical protein